MTIGVLSGLLGYWLRMPLPWMLGPMIGTTTAAMLGWPVRGPDKLRPIVIPVIGVLLGSGITAELFGQLGSWVLTLTLLPIFLCVAAGFSYVVYRKLGHYDPVTAFYAAMPGGLNEMLILGGAAGGDEKKIALAHAARVLLVIFLVVLYFGVFLGVRSGAGGRGFVPLNALSLADYLILGACAVLGVIGARRLNLPAAAVFGPMILSGAVHIAGWVHVAPPSVIIITAQIVIGTVIGARFVGATLKEISRDIGIAAVATFGMLAIAVAFAETVARVMGMPLSQAFLAYSPGGLTEMSLLTLTLGQDIAYVSVTHIIRITIVIAIAPTVFRLIQRRP
nr:AbrB family transcriptional regulator [Loktanella sp. M215]